MFTSELISSCDNCEASLILTTNPYRVITNESVTINEQLRKTWTLLISEADYNKQAKKYITKYFSTDCDGLYLQLTDEYKKEINDTIKGFYTFSYAGPQVTLGMNGFHIINRLQFPKHIYDYPLYIRVKFIPCPLGFALSSSKCDCTHLLKHRMTSVKCDIQTQTIHREGSVWVGVYNGDKVAASQYCPLSYCKNESVHVSLTEHTTNGSDSQCNYNRSGILCGGCQSGLSLALGSDRCLQCSNAYITLILPFAIAGILVVLVIKFLDLTVCHRTINGLIFYANIINASKHLFYSQTAINPITLFIAWFNLDLGIETCFYHGLTAYARTWLQFVFPVYIWCIAGGIVILAKYSKWVAVLSGNNGVPVLATLFLLSYAKLFNTIVSALSYTVIHTSDGYRLVWSVDGNVPYLGAQHSALFAAAVATFIFFWLPYTLILLLGRYLNMIDCRFISHYLLRLKPFLDANYAPFRDRHEYWVGVMLLVKATVLLASATTAVNSFRILVFSFALSSGILSFWGQLVYRKRHIALYNTSLFTNLIILNVTRLLVTCTNYEVSGYLYPVIAIPLITLMAIVFYKVLRSFIRHVLQKREDAK